jgi:ferric-dicitrate binding protein FerR (iron transport regulator)
MMANIGFDSEKINQFFKGNYTPEDELYVSGIFHDETKDHELKSYLSKQFNELYIEDELNSKNLDQILHRIHYEINCKSAVQKTNTFDRFTKWATRIAGILIFPIALFAGIHSYNEAKLKKDSWVEIKSPAWTRVQFRLPDGTIGWLNSSSSITYNGNFTSDRQVKLRGEAYFDVYKDKSRPFEVNTNEISVKVLGTRFNIASYANENKVEVVLQEGKLIFNSKKLNNSRIMKPNDLIVYDKTSGKINHETVQPIKYLSWTQGKLVFRNDPLDVIARRLERWYNISVDIDVKNTENIRWRATFPDESLENVLIFLKHSLPVNYKIENPYIKQDGTYSKKKVTITLKNN